MSLDIRVLRQQIADALSTIDGLRVTPTLPAQSVMLPPCAFIIPKRIEYGYTLPRQNQKTYFSLQLLLGTEKDFNEAQTDVDSYLAYSGDKSLYAAIGAGHYTDLSHVHCETMDRYGKFEYYGTLYVGATFEIETW